MSLNSTHIVLVTEQDTVLGTLEKIEGHSHETPLHRGFSAFLFNADNKLLIQKRAIHKKTWPGFWSNSFCGHPQINETYEQAVHRHAKFELNTELKELHFIFTYRYRVSYNNLVENEICPVYFAKLGLDVKPNDQEIEDIKWVEWKEFMKLQTLNPKQFTPWCLEETKKLNENQLFKTLL